ncbi:MAG: head-tail connector protein [Geminicoccaceae bacterium]|nr:head-tail connector protein [Geminicoccaceae bacterium]
MDLQTARDGFVRARARRAAWEPLWRDCFHYAQPTRIQAVNGTNIPSRGSIVDMFDSTAIDGVQQLAASLVAELTPPWSRWFGLVPGSEVEGDERDDLAIILDRATRSIQGHLDRSNFAVEIHQCFLDLVTIGTSTLQFEEAAIGESSAFSFTAVPVSEMFIDGDQGGSISRQFRETVVSRHVMYHRFPELQDSWPSTRGHDDDDDEPIRLVEAVYRHDGNTAYLAFADSQQGSTAPVLLEEGRFEGSPFITFRWLKGTGELYGRAPVMSALPDIKTANKVVELILKNASIAVTGIWLAEDDGVLNPANIRLVPGTIIPKAPGSSGLTPLQAPGRLDVSELVLEDLRSNIRHTLLTDRLAPLAGARMTATEVLERSAETARLLGAIYGRLQAELLTPLVNRAIAILVRRGEIPPIVIDGATIELQYRSPLARIHAREEMRNVMVWLDSASKLAAAGDGIIDSQATIRWLAEQLGVPRELLSTKVPPRPVDAKRDTYMPDVTLPDISMAGLADMLDAGRDE